MTLLRVHLMLSALAYLGIGIWTLVDPVGALSMVSLHAEGPSGVVEIRAMYGGLELGMAAFLAWCLTREANVRVGVVAATMSIGGLGLGRLGSYLVHQPSGWIHPLLFSMEFTALTLGIVALYRDNQIRTT